MKVVFQPLIILPALDQAADFLVERLNAHLELQRSGWKFSDDATQRFRQTIRDHFEMEKMSGLIALKKEFENRAADVRIEIERTVHKFEMFHAAIEKPLQLEQQRGQGSLPNRNVER